METFESMFDKVGHFGRYQILLYFMITYTAIPQGAYVMAPVLLQATPEHHCKIDTSQKAGFSIQEKADNFTEHSDAIDPAMESSLESSRKKGRNRTFIQHVDTRCQTTSIDSCSFYSYELNTTKKCENYEYNTDPFKSTVVSEFNLVCGDKILSTYANSIFFVGFLIGALLAGWMCDNHGRRFTQICGGILNLVAGIACFYSANIYQYMFFRFVIGIASNLCYIGQFVHTLEVIGGRYRSELGIMILFWFDVGIATLSLFGYYLRDWRHMQLGITLMSVLTLVFMYIVDESPRYLLCKQKRNQAEKALKKIAKRNGNDPDQVRITDNIMQEFCRDSAKHPEAETSVLTNGTKKNQTYSQLDLFTNGLEMTKIISICMFNWFIIAIMYFTLSMNAASLPLNIYANNAVSALVGLPAYLVCSKMVNSKACGRRTTVVMCFFTAGICTLASTFANEFTYCERSSPDKFKNVYVLLGFILQLAGKMAISGCLAVMYIYTAELFPTQVRANAVGLCSMVEQLGGIISPLFLYIYDVHSWLPGTIFGLSSIFAGILSLYLPETYNLQMMMSFEDATAMYADMSRRSSFFRRSRGESGVEVQVFGDDDDDSSLGKDSYEKGSLGKIVEDGSVTSTEGTIVKYSFECEN